MPTVTLPKQKGNSCAAHCTAIAVAELTGARIMAQQPFVENMLWPEIQFKPTGDAAVDALAKARNSDPIKIAEVTNRRWSRVKATVLCDAWIKDLMLKHYVSDQAAKQRLSLLFSMMLVSGLPVSIGDPAKGVFYNASFLHFSGATAKGGTLVGQHNMLVTREGANIFYYNPNETKPDWSTAPQSKWTILNGQNAGASSYVFSGVAVEMRKRA